MDLNFQLDKNNNCKHAKFAKQSFKTNLAKSVLKIHQQLYDCKSVYVYTYGYLHNLRARGNCRKLCAPDCG